MDSIEFIEHLDQYRDEFFGFVRRNLYKPEDAEDIFASAVMTAFENKGTFKVGTNFRAWVYKIIVNKCFVANRENRRQAVSLEQIEFDQTVDQNAGFVTDDPDKFLALCGDEIFKAFEKLKTVERMCFMLFTMHNYSYKEIGEIVEIPSASIGTHLARGRSKLRQSLKHYARQQGFLKPYMKEGAKDEK
ncbi:MAG: RNA polymerase sigma factor [Candidatus Bathyarchaeota archaeon]|nr:MAG: RNA polymerase sigma factor [Candidatus Bathyarchaeota archaeon]